MKSVSVGCELRDKEEYPGTRVDGMEGYRGVGGWGNMGINVRYYEKLLGFVILQLLFDKQIRAQRFLVLIKVSHVRFKSSFINVYRVFC